jgi:hypothetical protein
MSKRTATPVRFDPPVADRLASFVAANPGMSLSSAANRLVDEAMRRPSIPVSSSGPVLLGVVPPWLEVLTSGRSSVLSSRLTRPSQGWTARMTS